MSIILKDVNKQFKERVVINNFNYEFNEGKTYAIVGKSGKGKTTLLNMIGLLDKPTSGKIIINNHTNVNPKSTQATKLRREYISYLFQNYALCMNESVEYNLKMALRFTKSKDKKQLMKDALNKVGLDIPLNTKVYLLSGGEQQRVALARLILKPSSVILADEPTGNLDNTNADLVFKILDNLKNTGKTIIIVTHDIALASKCDEIINL